MPFIVLIVLGIVVAVYFYFRSSGKFTRGGDINKQGEEMGKNPFSDDFSNIKKTVDEDPDIEVPDFDSQEELEAFYRKAKEKLDEKNKDE